MPSTRIGTLGDKIVTAFNPSPGRLSDHVSAFHPPSVGS
jgi:hypothetical protein